MSRAPIGLPSSWPPDGLSHKTRGYSLVELSNYLTRVSTVDPPVVESELLAEVVSEADRPTRPAPLIPMDVPPREMVLVPSLDGRSVDWIDALRIVEADMPLRSSSPEPERGPCVGCGRCTPRKTLKARKHARRARG